MGNTIHDIYEQTLPSMQLKRHYSSLNDIIPDDILISIFHAIVNREFADQAQASDWERQRHQFLCTMDLIQITHVCRRWRYVSVNDPRLWSHILWKRPKWSAEMLLRCKGLPITIDQTIDNHPSIADMREILSHLPRTRALRLSGRQNVCRAFDKELSQPAPMLQSATLIGLEKAYYFWDDESSIVPSNLFAGNAPYLRRLVISRYTLSWKAPIISGLRHLEVRMDNPYPYRTISDYRDRMIPLTSTNDILDALEQAHELQTLVLAFTLPYIPDNKPLRSIDRIIRMPRLSRLILQGYMRDCADFAGHLAIHPNARLQYHCLYAGNGEDSSDLALRLLQPCHASITSKPMDVFYAHHELRFFDLKAVERMSQSPTFDLMLDQGPLRGPDSETRNACLLAALQVLRSQFVRRAEEQVPAIHVPRPLNSVLLNTYSTPAIA